MKPIYDHFLFGGDWNPEQWPEETWEHDLEMLERAHINEATINVFSWALLQSDENTYDFSILDDIVSLLQSRDFAIVMATSTAALPAWLVRDHPETMRVDENGKRHGFGGRHNFCPTSSVFREMSSRLSGELSRRYHGVRGLKAWHVGNEYGGGGGMCYCDSCARGFRRWLSDRYGSIDDLNRSWCANFWGHTIHDWSEVIPPVSYGDGIGTDKCVISGLLQDYRRYQNEAQLACFIGERDAIRVHDRSTPITTNLMGTFKDLDYFQWGPQMDVVSWDNYPGMDTPESFTAMCHDLMRGVGGGKPFMLMEQTPNQQNWFPYCRVKRPGEVRSLSWQAVGHGADTVQFFQLRQSIGGCERFHGAVIDHSGSDRTRVFRETSMLGDELSRVGGRVVGSRPRSRVAVIFDWDSYWSLEGCVGPTTGFGYPEEVHRFYRPFHRLNMAIDMIPETDDGKVLGEYDVVVAPALIRFKPGVADAMRGFVTGGGLLLTGYMSAMHDEHDLVVPGGYPGPLRDLAGVWAEEIDALAPNAHLGVDFADGTTAEAEIVASIMHCEGASPIAVYGEGTFYSGTPAVVLNHVGAGRVCYVGTPLNDMGMDHLIATLTDGMGIESYATPDGVEVSCRYVDDGTELLIVVNHRDEEVLMDMGSMSGMSDLLSGGKIPGTMRLPPFGVVVLSDR